jgi:tetratricopeptide (TPR) repeat protein
MDDTNSKNKLDSSAPSKNLTEEKTIAKHSEDDQIPNLWQLFWMWILRIVPKRYRKYVIILIVIIPFGWWALTERANIKELPGISYMIDLVLREPIPKADPNRFSIMVANLLHDNESEFKRLILEDLKEVKDIQVLSLDRRINLEGNDPQLVQDEGHMEAKEYLETSKAQVLIWGTVIKDVPKLYWTTQGIPGYKKNGRYVVTAADQTLPELFWNDLSSILQLITFTQYAAFTSQKGNYIADQLQHYIERVKHLLHAPLPLIKNTDRALIYIILGNSLVTSGFQSGSDNDLVEAIIIYQDILNILNQNNSPHNWALVQNNLGNALTMLGEHRDSLDYFTRAILAYNEALKERKREIVPLDWAATNQNLGIVLSEYGYRKNDTTILKDAVTTLEYALEEQPLEYVPVKWAMTYHNLGTALFRLGILEEGTENLWRSVTAFNQASRVRVEDKFPLDWSATQNNLGLSLFEIGEREIKIDLMRQGLDAYKNALKERKRDKTPYLWAETVNNMGTAFLFIGKVKNDKEIINLAINAFQDVLDLYDEMGSKDLYNRISINLRSTKRALKNCK